MTMNSNSNNINYNYDEQAKIMLDRFITQLDSQSGKADPDDASADLKYTRSLQRERLKKRALPSLWITHIISTRCSRGSRGRWTSIRVT